MFCPKCGSTQDDGLRFCKACGANLEAVKAALKSPERREGFEWKNTWVAEMMMSSEQAVRRKAELDRLKGVTPDSKRRAEIKGGVISGSVGIALMIFLYIFMRGLILSGNIPPGESEIVSRLWIVGIIPLFVGVAMIVNGVYISKLFGGSRREPAEISPPEQGRTTGELRPDQPEYLGPAKTTRFPTTPFSVTDETTRHLQPESAKPDTTKQ
ncbi:MAG: hypothetical protein UZ17_ACD001001934 [Acidobacteria bacterium OLB17]|nr:MAG: hypothetical protein UZ17_ACD001001934 [Acidobacteria bacterium OLB17]MCZ2390186.1 hypothetical protein [Acidobacteriota bacterium]